MYFSHHHLWRHWCTTGMAGVNMNLTYRLKELWRLPSAKQMAVKELEEAKRRFLDAQSAMEYTKRMSDYHADRIKRLTIYIESAE